MGSIFGEKCLLCDNNMVHQTNKWNNNVYAIELDIDAIILDTSMGLRTIDKRENKKVIGYICPECIENDKLSFVDFLKKHQNFDKLEEDDED